MARWLVVCGCVIGLLVLAATTRAQSTAEYKVIADCFATDKTVAGAVQSWLNNDTKAGWQYVDSSLGASGSLVCGMVVLRRP